MKKYFNILSVLLVVLFLVNCTPQDIENIQTPTPTPIVQELPEEESEELVPEVETEGPTPTPEPQETITPIVVGKTEFGKITKEAYVFETVADEMDWQLVFLQCPMDWTGMGDFAIYDEEDNLCFSPRFILPPKETNGEKVNYSGKFLLVVVTRNTKYNPNSPEFWKNGDWSLAILDKYIPYRLWGTIYELEDVIEIREIVGIPNNVLDESATVTAVFPLTEEELNKLQELEL